MRVKMILPALTEATSLNAQVSQGFRLGGINDPLLVPLCAPQDLVTFSGHPDWKDETLWNYEVGSKNTVGGAVVFGVALWLVRIGDRSISPRSRRAPLTIRPRWF